MSILRSKFLKKFHEFVQKEGATEFSKIPIDFRHPEIFGVNSIFETFLCIIMNLSYYFISINYMAHLIEKDFALMVNTKFFLNSRN